jgi:hypothetical protein
VENGLKTNTRPASNVRVPGGGWAKRGMWWRLLACLIQRQLAQTGRAHSRVGCTSRQRDCGRPSGPPRAPTAPAASAPDKGAAAMTAATHAFLTAVMRLKTGVYSSVAPADSAVIARSAGEGMQHAMIRTAT